MDFAVPAVAQASLVHNFGALAIFVAREPSKPSPPSQDQPPNDNVKITPRQAEELFHSVDQILQFDSKETGLRVKRDVKRRLTGRDEVVAYRPSI